MKNVHIELVKQWLADPTTVSPEELKATSKAATYAADAADAAYAAYAKDVSAAADMAAKAAYWVRRYEELTK
jgi:hypothetical protein